MLNETTAKTAAEKTAGAELLAAIREAALRIRDAIYCSPCPYSAELSEATGQQVYLKLENLQMTGSYKERGALNKILLLTPEQRQNGPSPRGAAPPPPAPPPPT